MNDKPLNDNELYEARFGYKEQTSNVRFIALLLLILVALFAVRLWWTDNFGGVIVDGNSMYKTLEDGEKLLMKYTNEKTKARRGDVIVVNVSGYEECKSVSSGFLIKRLIAVEGDRVRCTDGQIEILYKDASDWQNLDEPYAFYAARRLEYDFAEYEVGAGEVFFLGDNRSYAGSSVDSRYQEEKSHLKDSLYKESDIYGVVPEWALEHQKILSFIFF